MTGTTAPRPVVVTAVLAALVTAGALVAAAVLRPGAGPAAGSGPGAEVSAGPAAGDGCGAAPCQVLDTASVGGMTVELLADGEGGSGRLRAGGPTNGITAETSITAMGARLGPGSLDCVDAAEPVCLVRGPLDGGIVGEVLVWRGDSWRAAERPYFSDVGAIVLDTVSGDEVPEIIVVRHECAGVESAADCGQTPVLAEVFDLRGERLGCTYQYESPGELRGWPRVELVDSDLRECP
ncbi:hypothetical protein B0I33_112213 [Prauserella shujinwangii]|uniref:Uncharacterized protein n=1 Tax=Prauserella shujinwangii TaxID=1453103 RepID=A0A2T0LMM7_9PSEU|nr:hypothetical protein [Prauserella shujinwangii]PRX44335.1 hypothetical protein B0I33_112213 [Prauserella shujinwangii]